MKKTDWDDPQWRQDCRDGLLVWFRENARDLPWRRTQDPYAIWISEIMLQQTQVQQALPYYARFMERFPRVDSLASASLDEVLKLWEGMGYYARARNLHRAAGQIMRIHGGVFPEDPESVLALPGIGPYTGAAILSIAFNQPLAVVDGNVIRVLSRLHAWSGDSKSVQGRKHLQTLAQEFLETRAPGAFNEAMMELGALICTPQNPACTNCPVRSCCKAFIEGAPALYPYRTAAKVKPHLHIAAALIWHEDRLLIARRQESGLLGGLWEFPGGEQATGEALEQTLVRKNAEVLGIEIRVLSFFRRVNHAFTHFTMTLYAYHCQYETGAPQAAGYSDWRWISPHELPEYAFGRAHQRILEELLKERSLSA